MSMAEAPHILVVDDDARLRALLSRFLAENGFRVTTAENAAEARDRLRFLNPDLLVLDVMMPGESGLGLTEALRQENRDLPVLLLTARDAPEDRISGFEAGADDYLAKPFRFDELLARIRALHRRGGAERLDILRYGPVTLDRLRHLATVDDTRLDLTPKEFQLLEYFLLHPEEVVRRTTLLEKVWDMHFDPESNVVDVHVGNLRRKLTQAAGEPLLSTVRGVGFSLRRGTDVSEVSQAR
jgi:two-component system, OmpR family, response regulator